MKHLFVLFVFPFGCSFKGEIDPNIECTQSCEEEEQVCVTDCKQACVDAGGGDADEVCDQDCDTTCSDSYESCSVGCTSAD